MDKLKKYIKKQIQNMMLAMAIWFGIMMWKATKGTVVLLFHSVAEIKYSKSIALSKERYIYLSCTLMTFFIIAYYVNVKYFYIAFFVYFVLRVLFKETIEKTKRKAVSFKIDTLTKRYKKLAELFDNKIKVTDVKKDKITVFSNEITLSEILKKKERLEMFFNRDIAYVFRKKDYRYNDIIFFVETNYKRYYKFQDYIRFVDIKKMKNMYMPMVLGLDKNENIMIADLASLKYLFIAGEAGGGKSVMGNCCIQSLMVFNPDIIYVLIDLKQGVELSDYNKFPNCIISAKKEELKKVLSTINDIMIERLDIIRITDNCKNWQSYNVKPENKNNQMYPVVFIIDEIAEIKIGSDVKSGRSEEETILLRILQKGRAAGIYGIGMTQRPGVDQIDGSVRAGFHKHISFKVTTVETQRMTKLKGTENLKTGEFKSNIWGDTNEIYKGFLIMDEEDKVKKLPWCNQVYEDLKHVLVYNKWFVEIKEKPQKKLNNKQRIMQYMLQKVNKNYQVELSGLLNYQVLIKKPKSLVNTAIEDIKIKSDFEIFPKEIHAENKSDNYDNLLKFIFVNYKENLLIPDSKLIMDNCNLSRSQKDTLLARAKKDGYIEKASQTSSKINLEFEGWNKFRKENENGQ